MGLFSKLKDKFSKKEDVKEEKIQEKYDKGLEKTRESFVSSLSLLGKKFTKVNEEYYEELERILIKADIGVNTVDKFMDLLRKRVKSENIILLDDGMAYEPSGEVHGKDTNTIISGIMHSSERPMEIKALFQKFYHFIDCEEIENAEQILNQLKEKIGDDDSEIAGCNVKLKLLKVRRKR